MPVRDVVLQGDFRSRHRSRATSAVAQPAVRPWRIGATDSESRVLAIGDAPKADRLLDILSTDHPDQRFLLVGVVPLAEIDRLTDAITETQPDRVILLQPDCSSAALQKMLDAARAQPVRLQVLGEHLGDDAVAMLPGTDQTVFAVPSQRPGGYVVKRVLDVVAAGALLALAFPFLVVVAAFTKLSSRGPVFYDSWRVGVGGEPFPCHKFRTMCVGADVQQEELESRNGADGCLFKIKNDPRVTRVGRFLRRTSLDELPQLTNVLKGQMSLVGPRPLPLRDVQLMDERHKVRHAVLPGMTGLWQVSGRSGLKAVDMMELDMEYIGTWSLRADLQILRRTLAVVLSRKGAY
ncbi:MAG TPA: sugar transferase [Thermoleophilia bacterium]